MVAHLNLNYGGVETASTGWSYGRSRRATRVFRLILVVHGVAAEGVSRKDAKTQRWKEGWEGAVQGILELFASWRLERSGREIHTLSAHPEPRSTPFLIPRPQPKHPPRLRMPPNPGSRLVTLLGGRC